MPAGRTAAANLGADLDISAGRDPAKIAIIRGDESDPVSHAQLLEHATRLTAQLRRAGIKRGDRVAMAVGNSWHHVAAWYAVLRSGALAVDLNIIVSAEQWQQMLTDCHPSGIITDDRYRASAEQVAAAAEAALGVTIPVWSAAPGADQVDLSTLGDMGAVEPVRPDDPAVIAYTSGTTGLPKGVVHSHGGLRRELDELGRAVGYDSSWTIYTALPMFALHGYLPTVAMSVRCGGTIVVSDKFRAPEFAAVSRRWPLQYTILASPMLPSIIALGSDEEPDFSSFRLISCGGAPLHPETHAAFTERFGVRLTQGYGLTEVMGTFVMDIDGTAPQGASGRCYPLSSPPVRVQDDVGRPVPSGKPGEIAFRAENSLLRYWPDIPAHDGPGSWFPTGDVGTIDENGYLYLLDRKKDVILRGGFTLYSAEIERVLIEEQDLVAEATVIGIPDPRVGEVPAAYVVLRDGVRPDGVPEQLRATVRRRLGGLKVPELVVIASYDSLPRNAMGKVQKNKLRAQAAAARRLAGGTAEVKG
jgi:long-chain acyl-CoA synthetase